MNFALYDSINRWLLFGEFWSSLFLFLNGLGFRYSVRFSSVSGGGWGEQRCALIILCIVSPILVRTRIHFSMDVCFQKIVKKSRDYWWNSQPYWKSGRRSTDTVDYTTAFCNLNMMTNSRNYRRHNFDVSFFLSQSGIHKLKNVDRLEMAGIVFTTYICVFFFF